MCRKTKPKRERRGQARLPQREAMESEAKKPPARLRSEYTMQIIMADVCLRGSCQLFMNDFDLFGGQSVPRCAHTTAPFLSLSSTRPCLFSSVSTVSCVDELGHHDDNARMAITMENTYQMGEITFTCLANVLPHSRITNHRRTATV